MAEGNNWGMKQEVKSEDREERLVARAKLSNKQQLKALDARLGKGVGAKKERARLGDKT